MVSVLVPLRVTLPVTLPAGVVHASARLERVSEDRGLLSVLVPLDREKLVTLSDALMSNPRLQ